MRKLLAVCLVACALNGYVLAGSPGLAYLDQLNVFTANQRINAGLGVNVAPGATGTLSLSDGIFERSRAAKMGEWTSVAYSSGNFSQAGGGTWTVTSGDQTTYRYMQVGKTLFLNIKLDTTSIAGTVSQVFITIPSGFTVAFDQQWYGFIFDGGTATGTPAILFDSASGTQIKIQKADGTNWAVSSGNTYVRVSIALETQ